MRTPFIALAVAMVLAGGPTLARADDRDLHVKLMNQCAEFAAGASSEKALRTSARALGQGAKKFSVKLLVGMVLVDYGDLRYAHWTENGARHCTLDDRFSPADPDEVALVAAAFGQWRADRAEDLVETADGKHLIFASPDLSDVRVTSALPPAGQAASDRTLLDFRVARAP